MQLLGPISRDLVHMLVSQLKTYGLYSLEHFYGESPCIRMGVEDSDGF